MEEEQHLIPIPNSTDSLYERVRAITRSPRVYLAPSIKAILDERDAVKQTGFRFTKMGKKYRNGIWMILPEARFERVRSREEVNAAVLKYCSAIVSVASKIDRLENGDYDGLERCKREIGAITKEMIPALQGGVLYDATGSLPVKHPAFFRDEEKMDWHLIGYRPVIEFSCQDRITEILFEPNLHRYLSRGNLVERIKDTAAKLQPLIKYS